MIKASVPDARFIIRVYQMLPSEHPLLQELADEYRHGWGIMEGAARLSPMNDEKKTVPERFPVSNQRSLPSEFFFRVNRDIHRYGLTQGERESARMEWYGTHCYDEHEYADEKRRCRKYHVTFDPDMGWGFHVECEPA